MSEDFEKMMNIASLQAKKQELMTILIILNNRLEEINKEILEIKI